MGGGGSRPEDGTIYIYIILFQLQCTCLSFVGGLTQNADGIQTSCSPGLELGGPSIQEPLFQQSRSSSPLFHRTSHQGHSAHGFAAFLALRLRL